ncbi:GntR family transcriptional regulator [Actinospica durhamensis]|uniref:GntR family transcriptional regulator n=1 Tax=Actinospica durhamensis TaxID=1508375 RepID=A0A941EKK4_9ACTN|nr:GntR family transcriptional regulator [Actinospica durhamensis]MBR7832570.1 GntR family transcriptional regulator [Actinospica durhamensis]
MEISAADGESGDTDTDMSPDAGTKTSRSKGSDTGVAGGREAARAAGRILREEIRDGVLTPGQRLIELELAARLGVNRAAVRAALLDLTGEGLVERVENRGARVRLIPTEEAVEIVECRMVLEGLCAAAAAERVDERGRAALRELGERMRTAVEEADIAGYAELNRRLHALVLALSGRRVAAQMLERLHAQSVRHQFRLSLRPGRPRQSLPEHLALIDAICAGDPAAAERAARAHLAGVAEALRAS